MNIELASHLIQKLNDLGVVDFLVCAGARNAPLVKVLSAAKGVNVQSFYDERAAGFFALGCARRTGRPVAVLTTSGTAVAELLPAAVEAFYSGVELIFVTADRPKSYRGSGAPQSIEQVGIFSHYARRVFDISNISEMENLSCAGPTHINVCFDEPLIDGEILPLSLNSVPPPTKKKSSVEGANVIVEPKQITRPLVVLGSLPNVWQGRTIEFLVSLGAPIYAEAQSGLRECPQLQNLILKSGELGLSANRVAKHFDGVIRIGGVPTFRLWRDLDLSLASISVLSVSDLEFTGLARAQTSNIGFADFFEKISSQKWNWQVEPNHLVRTVDQQLAEQIEGLYESVSLSEPGLFRYLSQEIASDDLVFVGNSLPIREWDLAATRKISHHKVYANRGANGIDGLISTFLGMSEEQNANWLFLGDLSALYDLNALSFADPQKKLRIVVVNNGGGQIFNRMFKDRAFLNSHDIHFEKWAELFGFDYECVSGNNPKIDTADLGQRVVIEVRPDAAQTDEFWRRYAEVCR